MAEERFANKVVSGFDAIRNEKITFARGKGLSTHLMKEDQTDYGNLRENLVSDEKEDYLVSTMLVKGVAADRSKNACNYDYNMDKSQDANGMRYYLHKYFAGYHYYYQHEAFEK